MDRALGDRAAGDRAPRHRRPHRPGRRRRRRGRRGRPPRHPRARPGRLHHRAHDRRPGRARPALRARRPRRGPDPGVRRPLVPAPLRPGLRGRARSRRASARSSCTRASPASRPSRRTGCTSATRSGSPSAPGTPRRSALRTAVLRALFFMRINAAECVGLSTMLVVGFLLVRSGDASVGEATAAALYFHRLFDPVGALLMLLDAAQQATAALARLIGVADLPRPDDRPGPAEPADASVRRPRRAVRVHGRRRGAARRRRGRRAGRARGARRAERRGQDDAREARRPASTTPRAARSASGASRSPT